MAIARITEDSQLLKSFTLAEPGSEPVRLDRVLDPSVTKVESTAIVEPTPTVRVSEQSQPVSEAAPKVSKVDTVIVEQAPSLFPPSVYSPPPSQPKTKTTTTKAGSPAPTALPSEPADAGCVDCGAEADATTDQGGTSGFREGVLSGAVPEKTGALGSPQASADGSPEKRDVPAGLLLLVTLALGGLS